jgi:hypothetical protein
MAAGRKEQATELHRSMARQLPGQLKAWYRKNEYRVLPISIFQIDALANNNHENYSH